MGEAALGVSGSLEDSKAMYDGLRVADSRRAEIHEMSVRNVSKIREEGRLDPG